MLGKNLAALAALGMLSGCIAALPMALLEGGTLGGALVGSDAWSKSVMRKEERREMTASAIGNDLNPRLIKVSSAKRDGDKVRWTADTATGHYACSALQGRMTATCTKG